MEIKGTVIHIGEVEQVTDKFSKQIIAIEYNDGKFDQKIGLEASSDKQYQEISKAKVGDEVNISFNLRGREWNGKYYNTLALWKVEVLGQATVLDTPTAAPIDDDLPF